MSETEISFDETPIEFDKSEIHFKKICFISAGCRNLVKEHYANNLCSTLVKLFFSEISHQDKSDLKLLCGFNTLDSLFTSVERTIISPFISAILWKYIKLFNEVAYSSVAHVKSKKQAAKHIDDNNVYGALGLASTEPFERPKEIYMSRGLKENAIFFFDALVDELFSPSCDLRCIELPVENVSIIWH